MTVIEPVSRDKLKAHLRIFHKEQDGMLDDLLVMARELVEADTWRSLVPITGRTITRRGFPPGDEALYLPKPPLRGVTSVSYIDSNGNTQTVASYRLDLVHEPGSIEPIYPLPWPIVQDGPSAVTVVYDCGYANPAAVPKSLCQAILLIAAQMYEHSEPIEIKGDTTLDRLCRQWRVRSAAMLESIWTPKPINPKYPAAFGLWSGGNVVGGI